jgi:hypothetical protein
VDTTGPWNTGDGISIIEAPALKEFQVTKATAKIGKTTLDGNGAKKSRTATHSSKPRKRR